MISFTGPDFNVTIKNLCFVLPEDVINLSLQCTGASGGEDSSPPDEMTDMSNKVKKNGRTADYFLLRMLTVQMLCNYIIHMLFCIYVLFFIAILFHSFTLTT